MVIRCLEAAAQTDSHLVYSIRVVSSDGATVRGTVGLFHATSTEFVTSAATRIHAARTDGAENFTSYAGDRIIIEIGVHGVTPSLTAVTLRTGDPSATTDFALTAALTTDLCPWVELSRTVAFGTAPITADITEAATASEAPTSTYIGLAERTEAAAGVDTSNAIAQLSSAIAEAVTASDAIDVGLLLLSASTEAGAAAELSDGIISISSVIAEGVSALDYASAVNEAISSIAEPATAGDLSSAKYTGLAGIFEAVSATEVSDAATVYVCSITEASALAEESTVTQLSLSLIAEATSVTEQADSLGIYVTDISETTSATETADADISSGGGIVSATITDGTSATGVQSAIMTALASVDEPANATEVYTGANVTLCSIIEAATLSEVSGSGSAAIIEASISEIALAQDQQYVEAEGKIIQGVSQVLTLFSSASKITLEINKISAIS